MNFAPIDQNEMNEVLSDILRTHELQQQQQQQKQLQRTPPRLQASSWGGDQSGEISSAGRNQNQQQQEQQQISQQAQKNFDEIEEEEEPATRVVVIPQEIEKPFSHRKTTETRTLSLPPSPVQAVKYPTKGIQISSLSAPLPPPSKSQVPY